MIAYPLSIFSGLQSRFMKTEEYKKNYALFPNLVYSFYEEEVPQNFVSQKLVQSTPTATSHPLTSDGTCFDQGIAHLLMILAPLLNYIIHTLDASSSYNLF